MQMAGQQIIKYTFLVLPFPPSLNSIIACWGGRRVKTARHRQYLTEARHALSQQDFYLITNPVEVTAMFGRPDKRKRDLDNHFKAVADALVGYVIEDDSLIHKLTLQWAEDVVGVQVEIQERVT